MTDHLQLVQTLPEKDLETLIKQFADEYYNKQPTIEDELFDKIVDKYTERFNKCIPVGCLPSKDMSKITLPVFMSSLTKVQKDEELQRFIKRSNKNSTFTISEKLDGVSALYICDKDPTNSKLYTRGNGEIGSNITHLIKSLRLPVNKTGETFMVRGELLLSKDNYKQIEKGVSHSRNIVSGVVNSKKPDIEVLQRVEFLAYRYFNDNMTSESGMKQLQNLNFKTPVFEVSSDITIDCLGDILTRYRLQSQFEIDGLVVAENVTKEYPKDKNPSHIIAYKMIAATAQTTVTEVVWKASKFNALIPVVHIDPVELAGCIIAKATGHNARYIYLNKIGPGCTVEITRSNEIIPKILRVIVPAKEPSFPPKDKWKWIKSDSTEFTADDVDITGINYDENEIEEQNIMKIVSFAKTMEFDFFGEGTVLKLYKNKIDTIKKLITSTEDKFITDGIGKSLASKLYKSMQTNIKNVKCSKLMSATGIFGKGFGSKKFDILVQAYPQITYDTNLKLTKDQISNVKGLGTCAETIAYNLHKFQQWIEDHEEITIQRLDAHNGKDKQQNKQDDTGDRNTKLIENEFFKNKNFVISGFRDKNLEANIVKYEGLVKSSVSKKTDYLIVKEIGSSSGKEQQATELQITIMDKADIEKKFT